MLIERRTRRDANRVKDTTTLATIETTASDLVKRMLKTAHVQRQLDYSPTTMEQMIPVAVSYYLFWKGYNTLRKASKATDGAKHTANKYVVAAMRIYPEILEEIAVEHMYQNPLDTTNSHDMAIYLGVRLAQFEAEFGDEILVLKHLQADVKGVREITNQAQATKSA